MRTQRYDAGWVTAEELDTMDLKPPTTLVEDIVRTGLLLFAGDDDATLTCLTTDLAVSVGTGRPFLNHFRVQQPGHVLFFSDDRNAASSITGRQRELEMPASVELAVSTPLEISVDSFLRMLEAKIQEKTAKLVIMDWRYRAHLVASPRLEDEPANRVKLLAGLSELYSRFGCSVMLTHRQCRRPDSPALDISDIDNDQLLASHAKQWLLASTMSGNTGPVRIALSSGANSGHCGTWYVEFQKGLIGVVPWDPRVSNDQQRRFSVLD